MRKNSTRSGFTLVELLIGVVMMSIVIAGIAFTVSSGFDLYTTADSNAVVVSGVRFTADSFNRNVAPMLNVTDKIEILSTDLSSIPDHASISDDIHYIFLSNDSVVHRDSKGNHVLEGSGYIDHIEFTIPVPTSNDQNNYILKMDIKGQNPDQPNAKLDLVVESSLYNKPTKTGTATGPTDSKVYKGNILKIKASLKLDRLDLYDYDTKIKINKLSVHKGTNIEAIYDLINQLGTSEPMSDDSTIEWFISGSASADITVISEDITLSDIDGIMKNNYWQLFSGANSVKGRVLDTTGTFNVKTETGVTAWPLNDATKIGAIRCRVTPKVKSPSGGLTMTGAPKWSDYVVVRKVDAPSETFETIRDVIGTRNSSSAEDLYFTNVGEGDGDEQRNQYSKSGDVILLGVTKTNQNIDSNIHGASFVMKLRYDRFDNDRIYAAWAAGRTDPEDMPSYITVTNYSTILDSKTIDNKTSYALFLSTRSKNGSFGTSDNVFKDIGYAVRYSPTKPIGFSVSKFAAGSEIIKNGKILPLGVYELKTNDRESDAYNPNYAKIDTSSFVTWQTQYRVMFTVLEYYDKTLGKEYPCYIFRVRFLKKLEDVTYLTIKRKTDPWCIGPEFYASEPMWFGHFVGNPNTVLTTNNTKVDVKNFNNNTTVTVTSRKFKLADKIFYALKWDNLNWSVFRNRVMNARALEKIPTTPDNTLYTDMIDTDISNNSGEDDLAVTSSDRYIGIMARKSNATNKNQAFEISNLDFAPGFSINEIRSIMPLDGKLYSIEESIPPSELSKIVAKDWYKSYKNIIASSNNDINKKVFGVSGNSDGTGNNGSLYYYLNPIVSTDHQDGGIYDLQHQTEALEGIYTCPLHNELFKWFGGQ
ncbi:MAG: prepilin-type N-terminal cleavage/methylation domain-containing protein [Synergistaceae bacterium]